MKHLTKEQRYVISTLYKLGISQKVIAEEIGVHKSTISRELQRNKSKRGSYNPEQAHTFANERKERFSYNRKFTPNVEKRVRSYIEEEQWSPEEIVGYCKKHGLEMVSVERIYQYLRKEKQEGGTLYTFLRHKLKYRKRILTGDCKVKIKDRISIDLRPERVNARLEFGHWEADLISGNNHKGFILVLTERVSKQILMAYLPKGKNAKGVAEVMIYLLMPYKDYVLSITVDNGLEFSEHKYVSKKLETIIYFTHPYSSWEKGQVENMNKLIRQYYPKDEIINKDNTKNIRKIQEKINRRPRKNLNYVKPFEYFYNFVNKKVAFGS